MKLAVFQSCLRNTDQPLNYGRKNIQNVKGEKVISHGSRTIQMRRQVMAAYHAA